MAKVYVKFNSAIIKEVPLDKDEITIGRKPGNDILIDHPTISGFHGKIKKESDQFTIEDLNSTNGTFINGRRIKNGALKDHDQIGIAGHILDFHLDDESAPPPPPANEIPAAPPSLEEQKELLRKSLGLSPDGKPANQLVGIVRVIAGGANSQTEFQLKDTITYIGTSEQSLIKIKGFMAPEIAAVISRRPDGFFLRAGKPGYPKVNGISIKEQILLENGALIEVGGTNLVFHLTDSNAPPTKEASSDKSEEK